MELEGTLSVQEVLHYLEWDRYLIVIESAEYLSLSERSIRAHLKEIPRFKFGTKTLIKRSELDRWFEQFRVRENKPTDLDEIAKQAVSEILGK